jgi:hypothetical protein
MNKLNAFLTVATADNISKMSDKEIKLLAELIAECDNGSKLADYIAFNIMDKDYARMDEVFA